MKVALVLSWLAIVILASLYWSQRQKLIEVGIQAEHAWMETQTMPYVKSYDYRDKVAELEARISELENN